MHRVWTDGRDVVVATNKKAIPGILDQHYKVTGHTLRHTRWWEIPAGQVVRLSSVTLAVEVLKKAERNMWAGRLR